MNTDWKKKMVNYFSNNVTLNKQQIKGVTKPSKEMDRIKINKLGKI